MSGAWKGLCGVAGTVVGAYLLCAYLRDMRALERRLLASSQIALTQRGTVEYGVVGTGWPVLVIHGIGGGYDQGLFAAQLAHDDPFQVIAVSRFGYLRSPLGPDTSPEAQADLYAALLDELKIERAAVIGLSAGGPSSIQFALRHPGRCAALVLVSAVTQHLQPEITNGERVLLALLGTDFSTWLLRDACENLLLSLDGLAPEPRRAVRADPVRHAIVRSILFPLPISRRRAGAAVDMQLFPTIPRYPLEQIAVPTLVVHGTNDAIVPFAHGELVARTVPGAQFVKVPGGGHLALVTRAEVALAPVLTFLRAHRKSPPD